MKDFLCFLLGFVCLNDAEATVTGTCLIDKSGSPFTGDAGVQATHGTTADTIVGSRGNTLYYSVLLEVRDVKFVKIGDKKGKLRVVIGIRLRIRYHDGSFLTEHELFTATAFHLAQPHS